MALTLDFMSDAANDRRKRNFTRQEKRVASALGGVRTIGSGNKGMKGDVWAGDRDAGQRLMVECKGTEKNYIVLDSTWLYKLTKEARESNHEPVLQLSYRHGGNDHDFAMLPLDRWMELAGETQTPEPDVIIAGKQKRLNFRWFGCAYLLPTVITFSAGPHAKLTPRTWMMLPFAALKDLYAAAAAASSRP